MTEIPIQELFQKNNLGKGKATEALSRTPKMRTKSFKGVLFVNFSVWMKVNTFSGIILKDVVGWGF